MSFISEHLKILEEVFELEQELLLRQIIFMRNGVKYKYPPPYLHKAMELYTNMNFLRARLLQLKKHITYTDDLLNKYEHRVDYDDEEKKQEKWNQSIDESTALSLVFNGNYVLVGNNKGLTIGVRGSANANTKASTKHTDMEKAAHVRSLQKDITTVKSAVMDRSIELTNSSGGSLNQSLAHNFSEVQRMEDQSRAYLDMAKNFNQQAQLMKSKSVSFTEDKTPDFIQYAMSQPDIYGNPLGERALEILTSDPVKTEMLRKNFERDGNINNTNFYNQSKDALGVDNVQTQYKEKRPEDNTREINEEGVKDVYDKEKAFEGAKVNNVDLMHTTKHYIDHKKAAIDALQIDKAGVGKEVKDKLKDDASITMDEALINSLSEEKEKLKSNYDDKKKQ